MTATPAALAEALPELPLTTLLEDAEAFETAVDAGEGPVAVIGAPFAGRHRVLDHAEATLGGTRTRMQPSPDLETVGDELDDEPLVIDACQHLFDRRIDGFGPLTEFLETLAARSEPVVTGWNAYAWSYLDAVRSVGDVFEHQFTVRKLARDDLASVIRSASSSLPTFRHDEWDAGLVTRREIAVGEGDLTVPVPVVNRDRLRATFETTDDPETAVFERLTSISNGNPGVALALWERSQQNGEIRPSDIDPPTIDLDHPGAFLLRIVLSEGVVSEPILTERFGNGAERALGRIDRAGIISREGETIRLDPAGVPAAIDVTERRRIL